MNESFLFFCFESIQLYMYDLGEVSFPLW